MGIESILGGGAALLGGVLGGGGSKQSGSATSTSTSQTTLDPAIQNLIFGGNGSQGLLSQYSALLNKPQDAGLAQYGNANNNYLGTYGAGDLNSIHSAAQGLMAGSGAPSAGGGVGVGNVLWNQGATVNAPAQNNIDLTGSYNSFLNGGDTSKLLSSLQAGNALTNQQLQQNQASLTDNLQKSVLPSIRGGAIAAGQYGGSRQGIAEGNAISDFTKQLNDSTTQIGLANSANNANALAANYENGQNRALAATQGLGAQQYGVASQNASMGQQANLANQAVGNNAAQFNASQTQQANQFNAGLQSQQNQQNNSAAVAGSGLLSGLLGQAYNTGSSQNNYDLNQYSAINSLLSPYLNANATTTTTGSQPLYSNQGAGILGGVSSGLGIFNKLKGLL
jgi:hypothetical protein